MNIQLMPDCCIPQGEEEEEVVPVVEEDVAAVISPIDDVVRQVDDLNERQASHAETHCMNRVRLRSVGFWRISERVCSRRCRKCHPRIASSVQALKLGTGWGRVGDSPQPVPNLSPYLIPPRQRYLISR